MLTSMPTAVRTALLLFLVCDLCYMANGRTAPAPVAGDVVAPRTIPFSILHFGTVTLDPFRHDLMFGDGTYPYYAQLREGHVVSLYPLGAALVALPAYAPLYVAIAATGPMHTPRLFAEAEFAEKVVAAFLASLAVGVVYLVLLRRVSSAVAFGAALVFGLGTSMWAVASQHLWQHGPVALMLALSLWFLTWPERPHWTMAATGIALSLAFATRPSAAFLALAAGAYVWSTPATTGRRLVDTATMIVTAAPITVLTTLYNQAFYYHPLGFYGTIPNGFSFERMPEGVPGLLFSPNRGLLVFTPIAALAFVGLLRALRHPGRDRLLTCFGIAAIAHIALMGSYFDWPAGFSFGPRYLVDILPILALAGAEAWPVMWPAMKPLAYTAIAWSLVVQLIGVCAYPASLWNPRMQPTGLDKAAWNWEHVMLWEDIRAWWNNGTLVTKY